MRKKILILFFVFLLFVLGLFILEEPARKIFIKPTPSVLPVSSISAWKLFKSNNFNFQFSYPNYFPEPKEYVEKESNGYKRLELIDNYKKLLIQDSSVCDINPNENYYSLSVFNGVNDLGSKFTGTGNIYSFEIDNHKALRQNNLVLIDNNDSYIEIYSCNYSFEFDQIISSIIFNK